MWHFLHKLQNLTPSSHSPAPGWHHNKGQIYRGVMGLEVTPILCVHLTLKCVCHYMLRGPHTQKAASTPAGQIWVWTSTPASAHTAPAHRLCLPLPITQTVIPSLFSQKTPQLPESLASCRRLLSQVCRPVFPVLSLAPFTQPSSGSGVSEGTNPLLPAPLLCLSGGCLSFWGCQQSCLPFTPHRPAVAKFWLSLPAPPTPRCSLYLLWIH